MFKFDFQLEEEDTEDLNLPGPSTSTRPSSTSAQRVQTKVSCHHLGLDELLQSLPDTISYSPLTVPGLEPILRRDLFDARFQLSQDDRQNRDRSLGLIEEEGTVDGQEDNGEEAEYVDAGTDLIPGLYEGGLKTWEGGVDLVEVLSQAEGGEVGSWADGARVLEVGCGTALPTAFLLRSLLSTKLSSATILHLQDYNKPVLTLVSLPNLILAALPFLPPEVLHTPEEEVDVEETLPDLSSPGVLAVTEELKTAFKHILNEHHIELKFTFGHWGGLAEDLTKGSEGYDLVLTAETIYNEDSVDELISVLRAASKPSKPSTAVKHEEVALEDSLEELAVREKWDRKPLRDQGTLVLVAAKVLYFGVGGGIQDFLKRVEGGGGWSERVREWSKGVARKVVRIGWD